MKQRTSLFFTVFFFFFFIFLIEKIVFVFTCYPSGVGFSTEDILMVLFHGLLQDLSASAYLTVIPTLLLLGSVWVRSEAIAKAMNMYFGIVLTLLSAVSVIDIVLYPNWGFRFDSELLMMLFKPKDLFIGVSSMELGIALLAIILLTILLFVFYRLIIRRKVLKLRLPFSMGKSFFMLLLLLVLLYFPIRGNFFAPMTDIEQAYFSNVQFLNHATVNPHLNLVYSFFDSKDNFKSQYQFYNKEEAENIFKDLNNPKGDSINQVLRIERPNIILFVLDGLSANIASDSIVAPNIYKYAKEGISFRNFYANSIEADGGLVSVLSGYPVQPTTNILNYPRKIRTLPSIPETLQKEGYELSYYSDGKIEDPNLELYLKEACAIPRMYVGGDSVINKVEELRLDNYLMGKVYADLTTRIINGPYMAIVHDITADRSLSFSKKISDNSYLNTVAYVDSCLGNFIDSLKTTEMWENTLVIFTSNNVSKSYAQNFRKSEARRFHIPMVWVGGALEKNNIKIEDYASQNDIAATLLAQLKVEHKDFKFSKNILSEEGNKFAFYIYKNGFSMLDTASVVIFDNDKNSVLELHGDPEVEKQAKAYYQNMYIDLGTR